MKLLITSLIALSLIAGCTTTKAPVYIDKSELVIIEPPKSLYNCPLPPKPPRADTLTNRQVVEYIDKVYSALVKCGINMRQIEKFVEDAKKSIKTKS